MYRCSVVLLCCCCTEPQAPLPLPQNTHPRLRERQVDSSTELHHAPGTITGALLTTGLAGPGLVPFDMLDQVTRKCS